MIQSINGDGGPIGPGLIVKGRPKMSIVIKIMDNIVQKSQILNSSMMIIDD